MRYALYFAPAPGAPLARYAEWWFGAPEVDGLPAGRWAEITAAPRRYGFHATLKPPFALAPGVVESDLLARLAAFAARRRTFTAPPLEVAELEGFLALRPLSADAALAELAADCVARFDDLRAPPEAAELARRRAAGLSPPQEALLERWGYPYVLDEFRFHMTLTERLEAVERAAVRRALSKRFGDLSAAPLAIDAVSLFVEPEPGAAFQPAGRYPFRS